MKFCSTLLFLALSITTHTSHAAGLTGTGKVLNINVGGGVVFVRNDISSGATNPDSCTEVDAYLLIESINSSFTEIYAAILSSKQSGDDVKFFLDGCDSTHTMKERPIISSIVVD